MPRNRFLRSLTLFALALPCLAQVVHVTNCSGSAFEGRRRASIDVAAPHPAGQLADGTRFVRGRRLGIAARVVESAWRQCNGRWVGLPQMAVDGRGEPDESFNLYCMPAAPAVLLRGAPYEPPRERLLREACTRASVPMFGPLCRRPWILGTARRSVPSSRM